MAPTKVVNLKNYEAYRHDYIDGGNAAGGVITFVLSTCFSKQIVINTNLQCVAVQVKLPFFSVPVNICNLYLPPHLSYNESDLTNILSQLPCPFILVGDFNAHSPLWGDSKLDLKGKEVEKFIFNNNVVHLLNSEEATHYSLRYLTHSAIDLAFCSSLIFPDLSFNIENDLCFSGHFPIVLSSQVPTPSPNTSISTRTHKIWNYDRANWDLFKEKVVFDFPIDIDDVNLTLSLINEKILSVADEVIPEKSLPPNIGFQFPGETKS